MLERAKWTSATGRALTIFAMVLLTPCVVWSLADQKALDQMTSTVNALCLSGNRFHLDANVNGSISFMKLGGEGTAKVDVFKQPGAASYLNEEIRKLADEDIRRCTEPYLKRIFDYIEKGAGGPQSLTTDKFDKIRTGATKEYIESIAGPPQGTGEPPTPEEDGEASVEHVARYLTPDFALEIYYSGNVVTSYSVLSLSGAFRPSLPDGEKLGAHTFEEIGGEPDDFNQSTSEIYYGEGLSLGRPIYRELLVYVSWHGFPYRQNGKELDIPSGGATAATSAVGATQGTASEISDDDSAAFQSWRKTAHPNGYVVTRSGPHAPIIADDFFYDLGGS